jgi:hypothetical protein
MDSGLGLPTPRFEIGSPTCKSLIVGFSPGWDKIDASCCGLFSEIEGGLDCIVCIDFVFFITPEGDAIEYFALHYPFKGKGMSQFLGGSKKLRHLCTSD